MRYAQYEMNLDLLAKKRRTRVPKKLLANAMTSKFAAKRRINFIFQRALRKFAENVGLWLVFIDWESKIGSTKALSATFAKYRLLFIFYLIPERFNCILINLFFGQKLPNMNMKVMVMLKRREFYFNEVYGIHILMIFFLL